MSTEKQFNLETIEVSMLPELQGWKEKQEAVVTENPFVAIVDNKTYEDAKKARTTLVSARTTIEKQDKLIASKLKDVRTKAGNFSMELVKITLPHEEKQQEEVKRYEALKEAERVAKEKADQERKDAIEKKIDGFYQLSKSVIESMTFDKIELFKTNFQTNLDQTNVADFEEFDLQFASKIQLLKQQLEDKIQVLTDKENQRIEADKLAKEKADFEAEKLAKAKADKVIEDKRIADQKLIDDANAKRQAELDAKQKAIDDAEAKRQAEIEAEQKAKETPVEEIEVITASEEVAEPQTPVENINEVKTNTSTDSQIKEFLIGLAKEQYDHGDDFYAHKNKKGNWEFGSRNDEPLKFGNGYSNVLESKLAIIIFNKCNQ